MSYHTTVVSADTGRFVEKVSLIRAEAMVSRGQADWDGRLLRLRPDVHGERCRTRISWGGVRAAIGMSQDYTLRDSRGRVHDLKTIYIEDLPIFHAATLGTDT